MKMNKINIVVSGGNVVSVFSNKKGIEVEVLDHDNAAVDEEAEKEAVKLEKKTEKMFEVY